VNILPDPRKITTEGKADFQGRAAIGGASVKSATPAKIVSNHARLAGAGDSYN
jgi:hypothetical protein